MNGGGVVRELAAINCQVVSIGEDGHGVGVKVMARQGEGRKTRFVVVVVKRRPDVANMTSAHSRGFYECLNSRSSNLTS